MLALALLVLAFPANGPAAKPAADPQTVKVKIEASEFDRRLLLQKLNEHAAEHGMKFVADEKEYSYRITFTVEQGKGWNTGAGSGGSYNTSEAKTTVFDDQDMELFSFTRAQRRTDSGATNAVAKEIIKRMLKLKEPPKA